MPIRSKPQFFACARQLSARVDRFSSLVASPSPASLPSPDARVADSTRPSASSLSIRADSFGPHHGLHFVGEDDEEELLCDYAPNSALQADGTVGIVGEDGEVSLPVTPSLGRSGSYKVSHGPTEAQKRAMMMGRSMLATQNSFGGGYHGGYGGYDEEPCLSDSWHATETSDASITALRRQYHRVFGKETSSNNRQWLLRRLAGINSYGGSDASDDAGDFHSGNGEGGSDGEDGSPFTSASAGTHDGGFFSVGDSGRKMGVPRGVVGRGRAAEKAAAPVARGAPTRGKADGRRGPKGKRGRGDSDSADGGAAKTDASAAGKKRKGGHHSDSEDHSGEPPVKSGRKPAGGRKGADTPGANGRRSKHHNPWALEEAEALVEGVAKCGGGKWADIKKLNYPAIEHRTAVDLKDKWRNLLRIAMLPHQPVKSAGDKKREIPPELLARVRELAAKQAKKAAQDGRSRNGGR